jgi:hypothetical protein
MTATEKAQELVKTFGKQLALKAVDEMLSNDGWSSSPNEWDRFKKYCEQVKHELIKSE